MTLILSAFCAASQITDETATDGDSSEDSGEEDKSDGPISDTVADQADDSESVESKEEQETKKDQDSQEDACRIHSFLFIYILSFLEK
jgi:hypothetical protein